MFSSFHDTTGTRGSQCRDRGAGPGEMASALVGWALSPNTGLILGTTILYSLVANRLASQVGPMEISHRTMLRGTPQPHSGLTRRGYVFSGSPRYNGESTEKSYRQGAFTCLLRRPGQRPFADLRRGSFAMSLGEEPRLATNSRAWVWLQAPGRFAWSVQASDPAR